MFWIDVVVKQAVYLSIICGFGFSFLEELFFIPSVIIIGLFIGFYTTWRMNAAADVFANPRMNSNVSKNIVIIVAVLIAFLVPLTVYFNG